MSFGGLILTNAGRNEIAKAELGQIFSITAVVFGDGEYGGSYNGISSVVSPVMTLAVAKIERKESEVWLEIEFSSKEAPRAFYLREIGIIANGKLCYYDNAGQDGEYIDPDAVNLIKQKRMRFILLIAPEAKINVSVNSTLYALDDDLINHVGDAAAHVTDVERIAWNGMLQAAKDYSDAAYQQSNGYTDQRIAALINGAPETLDTLKEVADAIEENQDVVVALDSAIGKKADQAEADAHTGNNVIHITAAERSAWNNKAAPDHTHRYAGSASVGGSAASAVKLDTSAGSATQPVFFQAGKPVACTYTLEKSVPSNAKFTDTNTWRGIQNNLTSTSTEDSLSAAQGNILNQKVTSTIVTRGLALGRATLNAKTQGQYGNTADTISGYTPFVAIPQSTGDAVVTFAGISFNASNAGVTATLYNHGDSPVSISPSVVVLYTRTI